MRWYAVSSFTLMVIGFIGVCFSIQYFKKFNGEDEFFEQPPPVLIGYLLLYITSVMLIGCNFAWLKICLAPKLWPIELAASLVKN